MSTMLGAWLRCDPPAPRCLQASLLPARTPFRPSQMTVPETPSPGDLHAQQAAAGAGGRRGGAPRQFVDNTPSKGRVAKAQRTEGGGGGAMGPPGGLPNTYSEVVAYAERLFGRIRGSVAGQVRWHTLMRLPLHHACMQLAWALSLTAACLQARSRLGPSVNATVACLLIPPPNPSPPQAAPTTLKAAFLEPMASELSTHVALDLFAKKDDDFMAMFTGEALRKACSETGPG